MIEEIQAAIANYVGDLSALLPFGFAFSAGAVSAVNPCGFAMLPVFLGLYMGANDEEFASEPFVLRIGRAWLIAGMVTAGFVVLFGTAGAVIAAGGNSLVTVMPWAGLLIGVVLVAGGLWMATGRTLYAGLAGRLATRIGDPRDTGVKSYFLFGIAFATASLSCTLPIFLSVVGSSIVVSGFVGGASQFVLYALGSGFVMLILTIGIALFKGAASTWLRSALPYVHGASTVFMIAAGVYIVYYWLIKGELIETFV